MSEPNMKEPSKTDWERLDQMTDEDIDTSDVPALPADFTMRATLRSPQGQTVVTVSIDKEVLDWFRAQGPDYEQRMRAALRIYAEAHKAAA